MWKTISHHPLYRFLRYVAINGFFVVCLYYGFFEQIENISEGAQNIALFMAWATGALGTLMLIAFAIENADTDFEKRGKFSETMSRVDESVIPFPIDLTLDIGITLVFIWFGHYVLAFFYILSIFAGKKARDVKKDIVLKKLKSQGYET